jgi:GH25 family lysozyme M1 (1,4-beta-N-acetylmuramidase)
MNNPLGFDINHSVNINWKLLAAIFKYCFLKGAQGETFHDPAFQTNWKAATEKGLLTGTYDFWVAQSDPIKQADNFLNRNVDWSARGVLPPVIDVENQVGKTPQESRKLDTYILMNKSKCRDNALKLLELTQTRTGRKPIVYCSPNFLQEYLGDSKPFGIYDLWIAGYQDHVPKLPQGFNNWLFWQCSERGKQDGSLTGGELDINYFNGDITALQKLANIN